VAYLLLRGRPLLTTLTYARYKSNARVLTAKLMIGQNSGKGTGYRNRCCATRFPADGSPQDLLSARTA